MRVDDVARCHRAALHAQRSHAPPPPPPPPPLPPPPRRCRHRRSLKNTAAAAATAAASAAAAAATAATTAAAAAATASMWREHNGIIRMSSESVCRAAAVCSVFEHPRAVSSSFH